MQDFITSLKFILTTMLTNLIMSFQPNFVSLTSSKITEDEYGTNEYGTNESPVSYNSNVHKYSVFLRGHNFIA